MQRKSARKRQRTRYGSSKTPLTHGFISVAEPARADDAALLEAPRRPAGDARELRGDREEAAPHGAEQRRDDADDRLQQRRVRGAEDEADQGGAEDDDARADQPVEAGPAVDD